MLCHGSAVSSGQSSVWYSPLMYSKHKHASQPHAATHSSRLKISCLFLLTHLFLPLSLSLPLYLSLPLSPSLSTSLSLRFRLSPLPSLSLSHIPFSLPSLSLSLPPPPPLPQTGDKTPSPSSSNTLSSNVSSSSDDKHFGSGDLMDPELLGLTYIKGASTDSGIDTNPCGPPGARVLQGRLAEQGLVWGPEHDAASEEDHGKAYLPQGFASAILAGHVTEGSIGDLSEISSHSRYGTATFCVFYFLFPVPAACGV